MVDVAMVDVDVDPKEVNRHLLAAFILEIIRPYFASSVLVA